MPKLWKPSIVIIVLLLYPNLTVKPVELHPEEEQKVINYCSIPSNVPSCSLVYNEICTIDDQYYCQKVTVAYQQEQLKQEQLKQEQSRQVLTVAKTEGLIRKERPSAS